MKLKICGVKTTEEARGLKDARVDYIGLNFVPESPRCITLEAGQAIVSELRGSGIEVVALFRNQPVDMVTEYAKHLGVDYVQLHGEESPEYARSIGVPVIKAFAVDPAVSATELIDSIKDYPAEYFVLDRHEQGRGDIVGTGIAQQVVESAPNKVCLAGGLNPDNLADVLSKVQPYAIDISSGVRSGDKIDPHKVMSCLRILEAS